jgi:hypothetical protein
MSSQLASLSHVARMAAEVEVNTKLTLVFAQTAGGVWTLNFYFGEGIVIIPKQNWFAKIAETRTK